MENTRLIIVEDEIIVAEDLKSILTEEGYLVTGIFSSGEVVLENLKSITADIILMDIMLKGNIDGIKTAELIKFYYDIPVIYITACADEATLKRAKVTEPYGYILKPFDKRQLHTNIQIAIYRYKMEKKLKESEQWLSTVIKSIGDAVIVSDTKGCIKFINQKAENLMKWKNEEITGKKISQFFSVIEEQKHIIFNNNEYITEDISISLANNLLLISKDGKKTPIYENATPIRDKNGKIDGIVMVFHERD
ncbi:MAG: hypothetical protein A2Y34_13860 [Spirochaetes bacterium GWC1_27_15]|nr:MAG: hypothetical protein A2Z98_00365 [Spirochaetes bacterium GWB1_27_13]OHD27552.1 MAG: hypothetical protein A2Y34_13860 [Spirochaetes bacterium GWC1_27_15]